MSITGRLQRDAELARPSRGSKRLVPPGDDALGTRRQVGLRPAMARGGDAPREHRPSVTILTVQSVARLEPTGLEWSTPRQHATLCPACAEVVPAAVNMWRGCAAHSSNGSMEDRALSQESVSSWIENEPPCTGS